MKSMLSVESHSISPCASFCTSALVQARGMGERVEGERGAQHPALCTFSCPSTTAKARRTVGQEGR